MISNQDFNDFLRLGYIPGLENGTSMEKLTKRFGDNKWYVKNLSKNGLTHGIIKVGITEFHITDEKISGLSYRPHILFNEEDYNDYTAPWITTQTRLLDVELNLTAEKITYRKYSVDGPTKNGFKTAGCLLLALDKGSHTFIDTEGGVTFLFNEVDDEIFAFLRSKKKRLDAFQICRYYGFGKGTIG